MHSFKIEGWDVYSFVLCTLLKRPHCAETWFFSFFPLHWWKFTTKSLNLLLLQYKPRKTQNQIFNLIDSLQKHVTSTKGKRNLTKAKTRYYLIQASNNLGKICLWILDIGNLKILRKFKKQVNRSEKLKFKQWPVIGPFFDGFESF